MNSSKKLSEDLEQI